MKKLIVVCDLCGGAGKAVTCKLAEGDQVWEIDLCGKHFRQFADHGRRLDGSYVVGGTAKNAAATALSALADGKHKTPPKPARSVTGASPDEVRAWARDQGMSIGEKGIVARRVVEAYDAAHKDGGYAYGGWDDGTPMAGR